MNIPFSQRCSSFYQYQTKRLFLVKFQIRQMISILSFLLVKWARKYQQDSVWGNTSYYIAQNEPQLPSSSNGLLGTSWSRLESFQNAHGRTFRLKNVGRIKHAFLHVFVHPVFDKQKFAHIPGGPKKSTPVWFNPAEKLGQLSQLNKLHVIQDRLT